MAGRICQPSAAQWSDRVEMPGEYSITFEDLYQAFKARLMKELAAKASPDERWCGAYPLVELEHD